MAVVVNHTAIDEEYSLDDYVLLSLPADELELAEVSEAEEEFLGVEEIESTFMSSAEPNHEEDSYSTPSAYSIQSFKNLPIYSRGVAEEKLAAYQSLLQQCHEEVLSDVRVFREALQICRQASHSRSDFCHLFKCSPASKSTTHMLRHVKAHIERLLGLVTLSAQELERWEHIGSHPAEVNERIQIREKEISEFLKKLPFPINQLDKLGRLPSAAGEYNKLFSSVYALRDEICHYHFRLLKTLAVSHNLDYARTQDLFQEGVLTLMRCIENFKPEYGMPFISYAHFQISKQLITSRQREKGVASLKPRAYSLLSKANKAYETFFKTHHKEPDAEELADMLDVSFSRAQTIIRLRKAVNGTVSLSSHGLAKRMSVVSALEDRRPQDPSESDSGLDVFERDCMNTCIKIAAEVLDDRERDVFECSLFKGQSHAKIAKRYRLSRQRVQQILQDALSIVRTAYQEKGDLALSGQEEVNVTEKWSALYREFVKDISGNLSEAPSMYFLDRYAGSKGFWYDFFSNKSWRVTLFRLQIAQSEDGFDILKLSPERRSIFLEYFHERYEGLHKIKQDAILATTLRCEKSKQVIRSEIVKRGWMSGVYERGFGDSFKANQAQNPYFIAVEEDRKFKNIDTFLAEHFQNADALHMNASGVKGLIAVLRYKARDIDALLRYSLREGGAFVASMPEGLPAFKGGASGSQISNYLRPAIVGRVRARQNAKSWIARNISSVSGVSSRNIKSLRSVLRGVLEDETHKLPELQKVSQLTRFLIKLGWIESRLGWEHQIPASVNHMACDPEVVGSEDIARHNREMIQANRSRS